MRKFYRCECFASHNVYLANYRLHVKFQNERQFWNDYDGVSVILMIFGRKGVVKFSI